mgnify:CR=1 FL=1|tara:strand:- start:643 stop:2637 length:1995 start_codon:yes stop_codon:yes gene_type:complete
MHCLLIDNYDSFTWNLAHYIEEVWQQKPIVIYNDAYTWEEVQSKFQFDCIVVSPGPGSPVCDKDLGLSKDALLQSDYPVLGVCLGMQALAYLHGAKVVHAKEPFHGRSSWIDHHRKTLFANISHPMQVARYHSLEVDPKTLPDCLSVIATTACGSVMAIEHKTEPKWGVQFHPESILTPEGKKLLKQFKQCVWPLAKQSSPSREQLACPLPVFNTAAKPKKFLKSAILCSDACTQELFTQLFADKEYAFWLDSQNKERFSFMGAVNQNQVYSYTVADRAQGQAHIKQLEHQLGKFEIHDDQRVPFQFKGGLVGYFTYEMKSTFQGHAHHKNGYPDSTWFMVDRFIAIDHELNQVWCVAVDEQENQAQQKLLELTSLWKIRSKASNQHGKGISNQEPFPIESEHTAAQFKQKIKQCRQLIKEGETYEICLTERFYSTSEEPALSRYLKMREQNPAPLGAFFKTPELCILSCSPERFLQVNAQQKIKVKPIKGTSKRSQQAQEDKRLAQKLASCPKNQAENMMIVDLMRHDLSQVCEVGTIKVTQLNAIESFETVHQLVSTIEGSLLDHTSLFDVMQVTFPAGSITGAPKVRTMQLIEQLEKSPRGIYCGTLGYLSFDGCADLNVAIRTIVYHQKRFILGSGGAVTYLSCVEEEYNEMLLKIEGLR